MTRRPDAPLDRGPFPPALVLLLVGARRRLRSLPQAKRSAQSKGEAKRASTAGSSLGRSVPQRNPGSGGGIAWLFLHYYLKPKARNRRWWGTSPVSGKPSTRSDRLPCCLASCQIVRRRPTLSRSRATLPIVSWTTVVNRDAPIF